MISAKEAQAAIFERCQLLPPKSIAVDDALGLTIAEDVKSDIDLPPFPKALMDGFAVRSTDIVTGKTRLKVVEQIVAGQTPRMRVEPGTTSEIMTGAPLPEGADAIVMVEHSVPDGEYVVLTEPKGIQPGKHWMPRGKELREGETVVESGTRLTPLCLGLLASVGRLQILATPRPTVSILPTGDELVEPYDIPGPGQIRNSNATTLRALVKKAGIDATIGPIARDETGSLRRNLAKGLESDVLIITGGVSAGKFDLVPDVLGSLGVEMVFHKVRIKPGKPIWFGVGPLREGRSRALVFGLPGNPMSSVIGFVLFVRTALDRIAGMETTEELRTENYPLQGEFCHSGDRPTYYPARRILGPSVGVRLVSWGGSADLRSASLADGFVIFPEGDHDYHSGETVEYLPFL